MLLHPYVSGMKGNTNSYTQVQVLDPKDPKTHQRGVLLWHKITTPSVPKAMKGEPTQDVVPFTAPRFKGDLPEIIEGQDFCFIYVDPSITQVYCRFVPTEERTFHLITLAQYLVHMQRNREHRAMVEKNHKSKDGGAMWL